MGRNACNHDKLAGTLLVTWMKENRKQYVLQSSKGPGHNASLLCVDEIQKGHHMPWLDQNRRHYGDKNLKR